MVLVRRKPLIIDFKWSLLFMVLIFVTISYNSLFIIRGSSVIIPLILIIVVIVYMYFSRNGYLVIGANGEDFYNALVDLLNQSNYEFERTLTSIKIKEPILEISIDPNSVSGSGLIKIKNQENVETFNEIIKQLKNKNIKTKLAVPIFNIVFGVLLISFEIIILL